MTQTTDAALVERNDMFWGCVEKRGPDDCWLWRGAALRDGRGVLSHAGTNIVATHIALALDGRPRPGSDFACHTCDNPACVNPSHLWWGDNRDNILDASSKGRLWQNKVTHCPKGHPLSGSNLRIVKGNQRRCHQCTIDYCRTRRQRIAAQAKEAASCQQTR